MAALANRRSSQQDILGFRGLAQLSIFAQPMMVLCIQIILENSTQRSDVQQSSLKCICKRSNAELARKFFCKVQPALFLVEPFGNNVAT
eukprot:scaffold6808_cov144-Amphora_coffeaeformis.AAC.1